MDITNESHVHASYLVVTVLLILGVYAEKQFHNPFLYLLSNVRLTLTAIDHCPKDVNFY